MATKKSNTQFVRKTRTPKPQTRKSVKKTASKTTAKKHTSTKKAKRGEPREIKRVYTQDGNLILIMREYES